MDVQKTLQLLDGTLKEMGVERDLFICGGAALILLRVSSRATMDVDVLSPQIDRTLSSAAEKVGKELGLQSNWLNNGPSDLLKYLGEGWEDRCSLSFDGLALKVFSLSRLDLIRTKFWAACDRMDDIPDILALRPSDEELTDAESWVLQCDASEVWPKIVRACRREIARRMKQGVDDE